MKKVTAIVLSFAMIFTMMAMFTETFAEVNKTKVRKVTYYDKNPDPTADPSYADMPAVTVEYEDQSESDNIDVMVLKEVASEAEAENKTLGMKGYNIKGKWYKVIALWTVMPQLIIAKGENIFVVHTPLYFVGEEKPTEGTDVLVAIYDNKTSTLGDGVTVKAPGENGTSKSGGCQHTGDKKYSSTNNKKHTIICADCGMMLKEETHTIKIRKKKDGSTEQYCTKCEWHASRTLKKVKLKKVKAGKKSAIVKWKKLSKKDRKSIKKVAIQYSTKKDFKTYKTKYVKSNKSYATISKLKSGKKYYVRIRAYSKNGKEISVSKWSKKKSVKVK